MGRHGGGAFSGKDPSKVDRSACYFARYVAKNIVAAGLAKRCEVQVAYAIGVAKPMGVYVHTFGTGKVDDEKLAKYVAEKFDFRPRALIEELDLLRPIYRPTAAYGHFGRPEFSWEKTSRAKELAADLGGSVLKGHGLANGSSNGNGKADKAPSEEEARQVAKAAKLRPGAVSCSVREPLRRAGSAVCTLHTALFQFSARLTRRPTFSACARPPSQKPDRSARSQPRCR